MYDLRGKVAIVTGAGRPKGLGEAMAKRLAAEGCDATKAEALWKDTQRHLETDLGLHAPDDRTLVVELARPVPHWLQLCAFPALFPVPPALVERFSRLAVNRAI